ncbi:MAG: PDZ domain-containing protein [Candidatus Melainabacteria bacterium]|nr:PDZ domain-containing protein [Candidatus Melainabacteria bacterium]
MTTQNSFSEFILAHRLLSTRRCRALVGAAFVFGTSVCPGIAAQSADSDPVLKMDTPKMDQLPQRKTLKGGVFHHEALIPKASKLQTGASNNTARLQDRDGKLGAGTPKRGILNMFKVKATKDKAAAPLNAQVPTGIGIIGVKFVLGFGLPPTINKVFPGTPAHNAGLRDKDIIIAVDGVPTSGLTKEEVYAMIVGLPDTPVTVSVMRNGDFMPKTMNRMDFNDIPDPDVKRDYLLSI